MDGWLSRHVSTCVLGHISLAHFTRSGSLRVPDPSSESTGFRHSKDTEDLRNWWGWGKKEGGARLTETLKGQGPVGGVSSN